MTEKHMINIDSQNMKAVLDKFPSQVEEAYHLGDSIRVDKNVKKILCIGMGGSAIAGALLKDYLDEKIPIMIEIMTDYTIPAWVDEHTLVFAMSYSGNTEETLSAYRACRRRKAQIIVITSGGKLKQNAQSDNLQYVLIPSGFQPRNALAYMFFPLLSIMENAKLLEGQATLVKTVANVLRNGKTEYEKVAKDLVEKLYNKIPLIYASTNFGSVAYRWKTQFNENSKCMAFSHTFPELDHNALTGFEHLAEHWQVIILKSDLDHERIQKKMNITEKLIRKKVKIHSIQLNGKNHLVEMFTAIYIGDLTSYYLALRYRTDPSPVFLVEHLKKEMGPYV